MGEIANSNTTGGGPYSTLGPHHVGPAYAGDGWLVSGPVLTKRFDDLRAALDACEAANLDMQRNAHVAAPLAEVINLFSRGVKP